MSKSKKALILNEGDAAVTKAGPNSRRIYCLIIAPICCMCLISCLCSIALSIIFINHIILNNKTPLVIENNVSTHNYTLPINMSHIAFTPRSPTYMPSASPTEDYEPYNEYESNVVLTR
tara:strand:+ start:144 stop:500 length:357 start_codon:yes stop_codon:yes gene_type:complete